MLYPLTVNLEPCIAHVLLQGFYTLPVRFSVVPELICARLAQVLLSGRPRFVHGRADPRSSQRRSTSHCRGGGGVAPEGWRGHSRRKIVDQGGSGRCRARSLEGRLYWRRVGRVFSPVSAVPRSYATIGMHRRWRSLLGKRLRSTLRRCR